MAERLLAARFPRFEVYQGHGASVIFVRMIYSRTQRVFWFINTQA